jgi:hypothetical protein
LRSGQGWNEVREGQTLVVAAGETFTLDFGSRYVRVWSFTSGRGLEELIQKAGESSESYVIPENSVAVDEARLVDVCKELDVEIASL